jgi:hypothetical protein
MPAVVTHMIEIDDLRLIGWFACNGIKDMLER